MEFEEHKKRHKMLHEHLDELVADRIRHSPVSKTWLPSQNTVFDLMEWSYQQTQNPTDPKD